MGKSEQAMATAPRVLLLFMDGVGIGVPDQSRNPFFRAHLPALRAMLGGRLPSLSAPSTIGPGGRTFPLDATLGVPGTPQSGTGQIALLTGINAAERFGRHFGPWPPVALRPVLAEENLLKRAVDMGARVTFANAYPRGYPEGQSSRRVAAPPLAALGAGLALLDQEDLAAGRAVASEFVNEGWREFLGFRRLPAVTEAEAGARLAAVVSEADLTLFAHYRTDLEGHRGGMAGGIQALERVDRFLGGLFGHLASDTLVVVASDHGNIEEVGAGHTLNPVLGGLFGRAHRPVPELRSLLDIAPFVLGMVGARLVARREEATPKPRR